MQDHVGEVWPVLILQYSKTGIEEDVKVEPHKNAEKVCHQHQTTHN